MTYIKICGIRDEESLLTAQSAGAHFAGFVFYKKSPRYISPQDANQLAARTDIHIQKVGLFVNPEDQEIEDTLNSIPLDLIQLHGDETPERVKAIQEKFEPSVIKAIRIATANDIENTQLYEKYCDWLLFDAKTDQAYGGTGKSFDWNILKDVQPSIPWMLSGGLHADNIAQALEILKPAGIDISSGVEDKPGFKNPQKIKDFIAVVQQSI